MIAELITGFLPIINKSINVHVNSKITISTGRTGSSSFYFIIYLLRDESQYIVLRNILETKILDFISFSVVYKTYKLSILTVFCTYL